MLYWPPLLTTPSLHLWLVPLLAMAAGQCLVAIWAGSSGRHWFWRAAAVWAGLWLLLPIRAYEAAWLFALINPAPLSVRALNSASATRLATRLAAGRRHRAVAVMDGMFIERAL